MSRIATNEMTKVPIERLIPYINNARTHSPEQIKKLRASLREFGFVNPVLIDRDYNVIAGHGRIAAAREEGFTDVPCVYVDHLTEAQKKAYILADNRMAMDAGWDEELLKVELESLQEMAYDLSLTGFDEKELASYMGGDEKETQDDDFDLTAALEKATFVESGDLWTVGRHRLLCGDATKAEDVQRLMGGKRANLMETFQAAQREFAQRYGVEIVNGIAQKASYFYHQSGETGPHPKHRAPQWSDERRRLHAEYFRTREGGQCRYDFSHFIECEHCHGHLQASLKHYVDGTTEVGWVDVEHTLRAKGAPRPVVFRDSVLKAQIAIAMGWETFNADRMFETLSGISVNVDMVTLHFKNGGTKQFQYIQPKQIHRKRKETT